MYSDLDINRAAISLIKSIGAWEAELEAARLTDEYLETGDMKGQIFWSRMLKAMQALSAVGPAPSGHQFH